ncbi:MAG: hypothetical protein ACRD2A_17470, partial [Vicinamibacterales bacterium]
MSDTVATVSFAGQMTHTLRWSALVVGLLLSTSLLPGGRDSAQPGVTFDRADFLDAMNRLHQHYMAPEGLQRSNGLSI